MTLSTTYADYNALGDAVKGSVRNVLVCREAPVTYRGDVALENAWCKEVGTVGLNHIVV